MRARGFVVRLKLVEFAVDTHYDHSGNRYPLAHNLVTSHWVSGAVRFPVGWRLYRRYEEWTDWEAFVQKRLPERTIPQPTKERNKFRQAAEPELLEDPEFAARHHSFQTKLTLAVQLLAEALERDVPFSVVLLDGWYLAPELVEAVREAEKDWISIVKLGEFPSSRRTATWKRRVLCCTTRTASRFPFPRAK